MSKELETLDNLSKQEIIVKKAIGVYMDGSVQTMLHKTTVGVEFKGDIETLQQALQRLEAIDNTNPSKALEELENVIEEITISNADLRNTLKTSVLIATIKQALINKSKKEQGFDILTSMLTGGFEFEEDREIMIYSIVKACEETFGKDNKEVILIKELLNIDKNKYIDFCKEYSKNE